LQHKTQKLNILIVDDELPCRFATKHMLRSEHHFFEAADRESCLQILGKHKIDIVILDLLIPGVQGFELLDLIKQQFQETKVIILTSEYDIQKAVEAIQKKADDYIVKGAAENLLNASVEKIGEHQIKMRRIEGMIQELRALGEDIFIPEHPRYTACFELAKKAAQRDLSILIQGETGTGKEILTRYIRHTVKPEAPIISINCAAVPETLIEAELFGTEAHSYTDARQKKGKLELAHNGILFLDEIGTMPLSMQQKLLRALETRTITRVGSEQEIPCNFLLISATNENLEEASKSGKFRNDLFYRINDVTISLPSLREVPELIEPFVQHFLKYFNKKYHETVTLDANDYLYLATKIDGNIRSLKKEIQSMVALNQHPPKKSIPNTSLSLKDTLAFIETAMIQSTLEKTSHNISKTAEQLGLKRTTLIEKLKRT